MSKTIDNQINMFDANTIEKMAITPRETAIEFLERVNSYITIKRSLNNYSKYSSCNSAIDYYQLFQSIITLANDYGLSELNVNYSLKDFIELRFTYKDFDIIQLMASDFNTEVSKLFENNPKTISIEKLKEAMNK